MTVAARGALLALVLLGPACGTLGSASQRELLAQDIEALLEVGRPFLGPEAEPYVQAVQSVIEAVRSGDETFDWSDAFRVLRALRPHARDALVRGGMEPDEADALIALVGIAVRRLEFYVLGSAEQTPPETATMPASLAPVALPSSRPSR